MAPHDAELRLGTGHDAPNSCQRRGVDLVVLSPSAGKKALARKLTSDILRLFSNFP
ncbi:hypothetical protein BH20VER1_BH20VER1_12880 [soil metagenome]